MRVLIGTDAASPQVNGVVRTLTETAKALRADGIDVRFVTPDHFASVPLPFYQEIRLALAWRGAMAEVVDKIEPDAIHIATEGPVGHALRSLCLARSWAFTTSYHTRFPEYLSARAPLPEEWSYAWLRRFHAGAARTLVATASLERELAARGFARLARWSRGVDADLFHPARARPLDLPRPIFLSVGRVAVEKNLEAFLSLDLPGSKVVVGDGPDRASLALRHPSATFLGALSGEDLAAVYASADVFVFPSRTDTFGNVMLEALACGTPVAAFPVPGPLDVIGSAPVGALDEDLRDAALRALTLSREACRTYAEGWSWPASARQFVGHLQPLNAPRAAVGG